MNQSPIIQSTNYKIPNIEISHYCIDYPDFATRIAKNDTEFVRLHFGLKGKYAFEFKQLNATYELSGHHNNIMYSAGLELAVTNQSKYIETFGINFSTDTFVNIAQNGNEALKTLHQPPTLTQLVLLTQLNEYQLKKGFKALFGTSVFGYIHQYRMALAQRLLLDTSKSAKEIAYEIGYSSPQHFSKAFKKEFGQSPNSIRKTPN